MKNRSKQQTTSTERFRNQYFALTGFIFITISLLFKIFCKTYFVDGYITFFPILLSWSILLFYAITCIVFLTGIMELLTWKTKYRIFPYILFICDFLIIIFSIIIFAGFWYFKNYRIISNFTQIENISIPFELQTTENLSRQEGIIELLTNFMVSLSKIESIPFSNCLANGIKSEVIFKLEELQVFIDNYVTHLRIFIVGAIILIVLIINLVHTFERIFPNKTKKKYIKLSFKEHILK